VSRLRVTTFSVDGPFGAVRGATTPAGLALLVLPGSDWDEQAAPLLDGADVTDGTPPAAREVAEYLAGTRREFTFACDFRLVRGAFGQAVLCALAEVPFGALTTYGDLARRAARPGAARAVGGAVGRNPLPIAIPCHRVIASDGRLGGFSAGLPNKRALLRLEGHALDAVAGTDERAWSKARVGRAAPSQAWVTRRLGPRDAGVTPATSA
jgi:O-6-methylguanine DNA methyltransferase